MTESFVQATPEEADRPMLGWVSFQGHRGAWVHKAWYEDWPPPEHLAVSRIMSERGETYGVVDAIAWVNDTAFFPRGGVVVLYDRTTLSTEGVPPEDWQPPLLDPLHPAAVYTRRQSGDITSHGGTT